jgi:hypothetical protein
MPRLTGELFRVALLGDGRSALATHGWDVADGGEVTTTTDSYRSFIVQSKAEFGIAKQCYVDMRGGWISDRSVCYLAAGRPVVVQDTGVSDEFRGKSGFLTYRDRDEAVAAIAEVSTDYAFHAAGANALARDRFDAPLVVDQLVKAACDAPPH